MKKICIFLAIFACLPYFSFFIWQPSSSEVLSGQSEQLSAQETSSKTTGIPYYINKIGAEDTASTIANYPIHDTVVAVIDTGAELSHEDLADSIWINDAEKNGKTGVDDDGNGYIDDIYGVDFVNNTPTADPEDSSAPLRYDAPEDDSNTSHGTHVSGIIGMNPDNAVGYAGVGYHTKIMILKAGNYKNSFSFANATKAVQYAVANGADVINMSFGSYNENETFAEELEKASTSCLLVAAAGNDGKSSSNSKMYPASYPYVIGVMAGNTTDGCWTSSNFVDSSPAPYDILCPGEAILSTTRYNSYAEKSGTSMASPMAAGSAAVIMGFLEANRTYTSREDLLSDTKKYLLMSDSVYTYTADSGLIYITPRLNLKNSLRHIIEDLKKEAEASASALPTVTPSKKPSATASAVPSKTPDSVVSPSPTTAGTPSPTVSPAVTTIPPENSVPAIPTTAPPTVSAIPSATAPSSPGSTATPGKRFNTKLLKIQKVTQRKKGKRKITIKWKRCKTATRYQIRVKNKKNGETRWIYTKKTTITLTYNKKMQVSIRAQKVSGKKIWSGAYKKISLRAGF